MSKLKYLQKFKYILHNLAMIMEDIEKLVREETTIKIQKKLYKENMKILLTMCQGENLDFDKIKKKYITNINPITINTVENKENILDIITIDGNSYYYQNSENGCVYNDQLVKVGTYSDGYIHLSIKK